MAQRHSTTPNPTKLAKTRIRAHSKAIRQELQRLDYIVSGTLHHRTKVCGKPTCKCATDPSARHGPYYEWGRMRDKKLVQNTVTPTHAKLLQRGIDNRLRAHALIQDGERLTETEILHPDANTDD